MPGVAGAGLALGLPARVGVDDGQAEFFELCQEGSQAALVVEPVAVVGELVVGQEPGDGFAGYFAGPLVVGAVQPGRVGVAAAVRRPQRVIRSARVPGRAKPIWASSAAMAAAWAFWAGVGDTFSVWHLGSRASGISHSIYIV